MKLLKKITRIVRKTFAIAEKDLELRIRFRYTVIVSYIKPIIQFLMPVIIFGRLFDLESRIGPWTSENYFVFIFIGYAIALMVAIISQISNLLKREQYWKTLPALQIAPFNPFYLLAGYTLHYLIYISTPIIIFFVFIYIFYPISLLTLVAVIFMLLSVLIIFVGLGLILGAVAISNENIWSVLLFIVSIIFWFSCISYPFELFPAEVELIILLNPIYYIIDIIRWTWLENNLFLTVITHPIHIIILFVSILVFPSFGAYTFNLILKKFGTSGY